MSSNNSSMNTSAGSFLQSSTASYLFGAIFVILLLVALYYLYDYLYGMPTTPTTTIIKSAIPANKPTPRTTYSIPPPYEGGEYTVSFWAYITGWKDRLGLRKHILEIQGKQFSTLVVGLGAHKNNLVVRVHTKGADQTATNNTDLSTSNVKGMFEQINVDNGLMDENQLCDLPNIDLQRWVLITIVLNGRTCDVYLDGRLARSCVLPAFYKVDPNGVSAKLLDYTGFEGEISDVTFSQKAMNPEEIYRMYMSGPSSGDGTGGFGGWLKSIFNVEGTLTFKTPQVNVSYAKQTVNI